MFVRNLGDPYHDATGQMREMLIAGRYLFVYGIFYPEGKGYTYEAQYLVFVGRRPDEYVFERPDWWINQIQAIGRLLPGRPVRQRRLVDYANYRTTITLTGDKAHRQLPPGNRHDLAPGLRLRHRVPADRRRSLPGRGREGHRVPARSHALLRSRTRTSSTGITASTCTARAKTRSSRPSSATTTTPSRPTSRFTRWPGRSRPTASPAIRAFCTTPN